MKQRRRQPHRRPQGGFTLIEAMMVVAIIAVISAVLIGLNSQQYGASARNISEQVAQDYNLCKMRAVSTRRWHRCEITPTSLTIMQWQNTGMAVPAAGSWQVVTVDSFGNGVAVWDASQTVCAANGCATAPSSANGSLVFDIDFRPDGSSTGGTVFITQPNRSKSYRVVVYKATGSSYARNSW